jgi:succinate dehydrogenase/fumarate reductase-like Fe-S protein
LPVIRDLIVDMSQFFKQYHSIKPRGSCKRIASPPTRAIKQRMSGSTISKTLTAFTAATQS